MKRLSSVWLIAFFFLFPFACRSHSDGAEFLGKWVSGSNPADIVVIKRDGDKFVISKPPLMFIATYSEGALKFKLGGVTAQCTYAPGNETMACFEYLYTLG
jgi:hypothetical protein